VELDKEMRIPQGSRGELVTEMLGTVKMNLLLALENPTFCQPGDTLVGIANNGLMGVAETMVPQVEQLLPKMDSILNSLNLLLADPALAATLRNTEQITANLNTTTTELNRMVKNDLPQIAGNLTTITDNMSLISNNLKDIDYARTFSSIDSTLRNVKMLTDKLSSTDNTIGLFLNDPSLYQNLNATSINAASLLNDLKEHPKKYVHFSIFGRKEKTKE
jgi:phospholipid/cholesterol/gamma-HCH transport system substrate-binding protein